VSATRRRSTWVGIDFSGSPLQWRQTRAASAVWIAQIGAARHVLSLRDVCRVQDLPGDDIPFARLVRFLKETDFAVAGIDAPLAPPAGTFAGSRAALLAAVRALPCAERPFPTGEQLTRLLAPELAPRGKHIHRATEQRWRKRGINVRSVLWNGPRGGAPFAAASFTLVAATGLPVWPWDAASQARVLAETFPAAQLRTWNLPWFGYNGDTQAARRRRRTIVRHIAARLVIAPHLEQRLLGSADALDSVLCALAARAVSTDVLADPPGAESAAEGWIAVHR
jgi:hypothetical protein